MKKVNTSIKGTISELRVEVDLLSRGYYVFRSESAGCPCDIIAMKEGRCFKIEIRTLKDKGQDKGIIPPHKIQEHEPGLINWFAFVFWDEIIYYDMKTKHIFRPR